MPTYASLSPPIHAAFYYPWYHGPTDPNGHWVEGHIYTPLLGEYVSNDPTIFRYHALMAYYARLNAFICSWWGQSDSFRTDESIKAFLTYLDRESSNPYPNLKLCVYYEPESVLDPTAAQIKDDLDYLEANMFSRKSYLRVEGKPVVFVYHGGHGFATMVERWTDAKALYGKPLYTNLQVYDGWAADPEVDSWHQYPTVHDPDTYLDGSAFSAGSMTACPGFHNPNQGPDAPLPRNKTAFESAVSDLSFADKWRLINSFSEWGEASNVESATEFADSTDEIAFPNGEYLQVLRERFPAVRKGSMSAAAALVIAGR